MFSTVAVRRRAQKDPWWVTRALILGGMAGALMSGEGAVCGLRKAREAEGSWL